MKYDSVKAHDGVKIRVARFEAIKPRGVVQIIHGFGEGLIHYIDVATFLSQNGYTCVIHDQRGFGEMSDLLQRQRRKARGVVPGYDYFIEDIKTVRNQINHWYPDLPVILYGHSMGGNIAANYLIRYGGSEKLILEAPWLRLCKPLPKFATVVAGFLGRLSEKIAIDAKVNIDHISRDPEVNHSRRTDGIYHTRMSLRMYAQVVKAGEYAITNAAKISVPTLLLCPGEDKIVCPDAIREFGSRANRNVEMVEYPGAYHCLHADIIKAEVIEKVLHFINTQIV